MAHSFPSLRAVERWANSLMGAQSAAPATSLTLSSTPTYSNSAGDPLPIFTDIWLLWEIPGVRRAWFVRSKLAPTFIDNTGVFSGMTGVWSPHDTVEATLNYQGFGEGRFLSAVNVFGNGVTQWTNLSLDAD